ncbi:hypothetical protein [Trinickia mobilis]|uniref:hypothetical protein n=1 Tax=Trinickia mobilis TaxID=2816356 RepID=UPI001A8D98FB|nr:hypothetical protein [Trinickia mobilis]
MERTRCRETATNLTCVQAKTVTSSVEVDFDLHRQIDELCIALFDRWCERRELTPLIYLLHAWPFYPATLRPIETLSAALRELLIFHADTVDELDRQLIGDIHAIGRC